MNLYQDNSQYYPPFLRSNTNQKTHPKLFNSDEAFMLGNLFKDLYMSYKGFSNYCLQPTTQQQKDMLEVQMYNFVAHDINLYLDMYPENQRMVHLYQEYAQKSIEAIKNYENKYGPLTVKDSSNQVPFQWVENSWPWEKQGGVQ